MSHWSIAMTTLKLFLLWSVSVNAVRISPKLDFGESNTKSLNAGFRPDTETRYLRDSGKFSYGREQTEPKKLENIGVICISGNCNATTTDNENGISADVLVHIKTNVDVAKAKNDTVQPVPDVPVVVGTKTSTIPTLDYNRPINAPNPVVYGSNYPAVDFLPPPNNAFIPSPRPGYIQNPQLQADSQIRGYPSFTNYAPKFQGIDNNIAYQTTYLGPTFNANDNINNNRPVSPQSSWYPKGNRGGNYNPVEFRKIYSTNSWSPVKWSRSNPVNSERRTGIPRWTPCVCQNPEVHHYSTTPLYTQRNQPPGINGKLAPLV